MIQLLFARLPQLKEEKSSTNNELGKTKINGENSSIFFFRLDSSSTTLENKVKRKEKY